MNKPRVIRSRWLQYANTVRLEHGEKCLHKLFDLNKVTSTKYSIKCQVCGRLVASEITVKEFLQTQEAINYLNNKGFYVSHKEN